ncbi:MAG TPA: M2 family metallopeptidase [Thermoanaerobaculia bacterium]|nr:M2 family metallopeptidase [Thermoanaerobaculia bacterium]
MSAELGAQAPAATPGAKQDAKQFVDGAEKRLLKLWVDTSRADWVRSTYITGDTEALAAQANERSISAAVAFAKDATKYESAKTDAETARKLKLLRLSLTLATPHDPDEASEVTRIAAEMEGIYGKGKYCPPGGQCVDLEDITKIMATSRDAKQLLDVWTGWHAIARPIKKDYVRYVELANKGARELGFADNGAMWRSKYDMPPDAFAKELDRLWEQVRPLYVSLHAYVRWKLHEKYGDAVPAKGPIPAHLLGNMWAQTWDNVYPLVAPADADKGYDLTQILKGRRTDAVQMVKYGEGFFTSLGFDPLPKTFWERSMLTKPHDREVVCHASAWDVDYLDDLRIKMCIDITAEDFTTVHHELGHNFYQRAYKAQPPLFRDSANDGFHEAIGDTIALSVTPEYLVKLGLLNKAPDTSKDVGLLLNKALEKIAFLPFGLMIDQWRWRVFSGEITPANYNKAWWDLRLKYQGVAAPAVRTEEDFDPGAKYHVPANVPYTRYFLADILQFQFHRALAKTAGCTSPLHRCSIYGNKAAGDRLKKTLEMGQSKPWPDALEALTGQREMDASAIRDYFAPLQKWLDEQNKGKPVGW